MLTDALIVYIDMLKIQVLSLKFRSQTYIHILNQKQKWMNAIFMPDTYLHVFNLHLQVCEGWFIVPLPVE